ncbi:unnamed protein product, partial [Prunus brigantina]
GQKPSFSTRTGFPRVGATTPQRKTRASLWPPHKLTSSKRFLDKHFWKKSANLDLGLNNQEQRMGPPQCHGQ